MVDKIFKVLERLNVQIDTWIDDEEYGQIHKRIKFENSVEKQIEIIFSDNSKTPCNKNERNPDLDKLFQKLFSKNPEQAILIRNIQNSQKVSPKALYKWRPLFVAKCLRAKIQKNGTDPYIKHLDDLVIYLQRKLPYQSPLKEPKHIILQHLYFQELSACGRPGLESLGFALQAYGLIENKEDKKGTENNSHYSFNLYKLWAKYNQGIGYLHSGQKMEAAKAFNEVITEFEELDKKGIFSKEKKEEKTSWQSLLYDQAVLFKSELLEDLQFSYHTVQSIEKLDGRKKENGLIKKALAYRDMGRLEEAKNIIKELIIREIAGANGDGIENIFEAFESWQRGKKNIRSKALGLLFDYYLLEFQDGKESNKDDIKYFIEKIKQYRNDFIQSKTERVSYYQQVARFLKWLSEQYKITNYKDEFYREQIKKLYGDLRDFLLPDKLDKKQYGISLGDFGKYDYERYSESMEKFYKNLTDGEYNPNEIYLLDKLNDYEKESSFLFKFKELERRQRIARLDNGHSEKCEKPTKCFHENPDNSSAFKDVLKCSKKGESAEESISAERRNNTGHHGSHNFDIRFGPLIDKDYETIMERENSRFLDFLAYKSHHPVYYSKEGIVKKSYHFMGLQRWNSQTPTLTLSQGGGYLLYEQDEHGKVTLGIAIDPGFDFVDNLFHMGFTLNDIDFILLSHAHLDHIRDFEPIVSSLLDLQKRKSDSRKKIHAMMTWGVYRQLEHVITNPTLREFLADTYIVDIDKDLDLKPEEPPESFSFGKPPKSPNNRNILVSITHDDGNSQKKYIEIKPTQAYHNDYTQKSDSYGYIINFYDDRKNPVFSFGYTGDTKWHDAEIDNNEIMPGIHTQYRKCDAVCIHLGALIESEKGEKFKDYEGDKCDALIEKKGHLYLFGLLRYLKKIQEGTNENKLLLISEFGEELKGGIRIDFIKRLNDLFTIAGKAIKKDQGIKNAENQFPVCLPVDIGLNVILAWNEKMNTSRSRKKWKKGTPHKVWCHGCDKFVDADKIRYRHFEHGNNDEALFYFCNVCLKSKPENAIQNRMRLICESGVPLEKAHEQNI